MQQNNEPAPQKTEEKPEEEWYCQKCGQPASKHSSAYGGPTCPAASPIPDGAEGVPEEIHNWIRVEYDKPENAIYNFDEFKYGAIAMYHKMKEKVIQWPIAAAIAEENTLLKGRIATLTKEREQLGAEIIHWTLRLEKTTKERDTARNENESLIASVEAWEGKYHRAEEDLDEKNCEVEKWKALLEKIYRAHRGSGITQELEMEVYRALP